MTEVTAESAPKRRKGAGLALFAITVLLTGGGGFAMGALGLIPLPMGAGNSNSPGNATPDWAASAGPPPTFYSLPEIIIPLGTAVSSQYLRAKIHMEIDPSSIELLQRTEPRIMDSLNIFLRAVDERDMSSILAMENLRAEMLRRVRLVTGDKVVHAVLIGEFLLR